MTGTPSYNKTEYSPLERNASDRPWNPPPAVLAHHIRVERQVAHGEMVVAHSLLFPRLPPQPIRTTAEEDVPLLIQHLTAFTIHDYAMIHPDLAAAFAADPEVGAGTGYLVGFDGS